MDLTVFKRLPWGARLPIPKLSLEGVEVEGGERASYALSEGGSYIYNFP